MRINIAEKSLGEILSRHNDLRKKGLWACININTNMPWPTEAQSFIFDRMTVWVMPYCKNTYPGLAVNCGSILKREEGWALLHRALSVICWIDDAGATVTHMSGGNLPRMVGRNHKTDIAFRDAFDLTEIPTVSDSRAQLAIALMREGRGLNHPAFAFLTYYKALEAAIPDGRARGSWISDNLPRIQGAQAQRALQDLQSTIQGDVGEHLYQSGRQAIAHAKKDPLINPDDPGDLRRLSREGPIMEALAVLAIEERLGVQTSQTIYRQHLHELRGWKSVFGDPNIAAFLTDEAPPNPEIKIPPLNVRLRHRPPFLPLEKMNPVNIYQREGGVEITYQSTDNLVKLSFFLNFSKERLHFDLNESLHVYDDGSSAAAKNSREIQRFHRDYLQNGELQMWDADSGSLMSRCDPFIPQNFRLDLKAANAAIKRWDTIVAERESAEATRDPAP